MMYCINLYPFLLSGLVFTVSLSPLYRIVNRSKRSGRNWVPFRAGTHTIRNKATARYWGVYGVLMIIMVLLTIILLLALDSCTPPG